MEPNALRRRIGIALTGLAIMLLALATSPRETVADPLSDSCFDACDWNSDCGKSCYCIHNALLCASFPDPEG